MQKGKGYTLKDIVVECVQTMTDPGQVRLEL